MTAVLNKTTTLNDLYDVLKRPFSVIIFDIDGVLAEHASSVQEYIIEQIVSILNRRVYVNLASGRPHHVNDYYRSKGGRDINEIFEQIRNCKNLEDSNNLKYLFSFEQNGSAISDGFKIADPRKNSLKLQHPLMPTIVQERIWEYLSSTQKTEWFSHVEHKSHSMALWLSRHVIKEEVKTLVDQCLSHFKIDHQFESFQTGNTIDIGPIGVSKATAVDFYLEAGFTLEQIARVGDSTYAGGNDQSMVQYKGIGDNGGFSVEHYDELEPFPIVSLPKIIEKNGVAATHWLLENIRFNENQPYVF